MLGIFPVSPKQGVLISTKVYHNYICNVKLNFGQTPPFSLQINENPIIDKFVIQIDDIRINL